MEGISSLLVRINCVATTECSAGIVVGGCYCLCMCMFRLYVVYARDNVCE